MGAIHAMVPAQLVALVKVSEGLARLQRDGLVHVYRCPAGFATQGFGIRVADMAVPPITPAEAERRLVAILPRYLAQTLQSCPRLASDPARLSALTDFTYNLGPAALAGSTLRKRVNAGQWELARRELAKWVHGAGRVLPGLVRRRAAEAELL